MRWERARNGIAVYLGFSDEDGGDRHRSLALLRRDLLDGLAAALWLATAGTAVAVGLFDWSPRHVAVGAAIGVVIWSAGEYFVTVRPRLPRGPLPPVPLDGEWEQRETIIRLAVRFTVLSPLVVGLVLAVEGLGAGPAFVPGMPAGYAVANAIGVWRVRAWERDHGARIAFRREYGEERRFAVPGLPHPSA